MKNKIIHKITFLTLIIIIFSSFKLQDDIPAGIKQAFSYGDSKKLSNYIGATLELSILDNESIYSKSQALMIIQNFFDKYPPTGFVILHQGSKASSKYAIGNLTTNNKTFRVTLLLKIRENQNILHQLRIEEENAR
jgi:hypothetical protein